MYSDLYTKKRYAPSRFLVALALLAVSAGMGFYFFSSTTSNIRASKQNLTLHEQVNITSSQAGVFWSTDTPDKGWLLYGIDKSNLQSIAFDEQNSTQGNGMRRFHYAIMKNLKPDTTYYYRIISNNNAVENDGRPFEIHTPLAQGSSGQLSPSYGKVVNANGKDVVGAIVLLSISDAYPLLAFTGQSGEWLTPLQYVVHTKNNTYVQLTEDTLISLAIYKEDQVSRVKTTLSKSHPIRQAIVIGQNYIFLEENNVLAAAQKKTSSLSVKSKDTKSFSVMFPRDNAVIPGTAPLIKGYAPPMTDVSVRLNTVPPFSSVVKADRYGDWDVPIRSKIAPGTYLAVISGRDLQGNLKEVTRKFTLIKSGEMVLGESTTSTPSATLQPVSPTVNPSLAVVTPSETISPTTISPTPIVYSNVSPVPPPPVSGVDSVWPYAVTGAGLLMVGAGLILIF